jgi:hypothetical protein
MLLVFTREWLQINKCCDRVWLGLAVEKTPCGGDLKMGSRLKHAGMTE